MQGETIVVARTHRWCGGFFAWRAQMGPQGPSSLLVDTPKTSRGGSEPAGRVEAGKSCLVVDVDPFAAGPPSLLDRLPYQSAPDALALPVRDDGDIEQEGMAVTVPHHVDESDQPCLSVRGHPPEAEWAGLPPPILPGCAAERIRMQTVDVGVVHGYSPPEIKAVRFLHRPSLPVSTPFRPAFRGRPLSDEVGAQERQRRLLLRLEKRTRVTAPGEIDRGSRREGLGERLHAGVKRVIVARRDPHRHSGQ
jgi:hypothetical protein